MAKREVIALNEDTPQLEAPQVGDTYTMPRDVEVDADFTITGTHTTTGNFTFKLSDNAGASKVSITDSDDAEVASVDSDGLLSSVSLLSTGGYIRTSAVALDFTRNDSGSGTGSDFSVTATDISVQSTMYIGWSDSTSDAGNGSTLRLYRDATGVLAQRVGAGTPNTYRIYNTYTDASNYERLSISGDGTIEHEAAGTGTVSAVNMHNAAFTVATLPAGTVGMTARITDGDGALAWGATAVNSGAGATPYLVWYNGTNWTILGS